MVESYACFDCTSMVRVYSVCIYNQESPTLLYHSVELMLMSFCENAFGYFTNRIFVFSVPINHILIRDDVSHGIRDLNFSEVFS